MRISRLVLFWFAQYVYVPTLPDTLFSRTESLKLVGHVLAMYSIWQAVVRLL